MEALSWFQILVPKTGQNLEPRCESGPQVHQAPCIRHSQLHELLSRSLRIRLLWLASPGQPTVRATSCAQQWRCQMAPLEAHPCSPRRALTSQGPWKGVPATKKRV